MDTIYMRHSRKIKQILETCCSLCSRNDHLHTIIGTNLTYIYTHLSCANVMGGVVVMSCWAQFEVFQRISNHFTEAGISFDNLHYFFFLIYCMTNSFMLTYTIIFNNCIFKRLQYTTLTQVLMIINLHLRLLYVKGYFRPLFILYLRRKHLKVNAHYLSASNIKSLETKEFLRYCSNSSLLSFNR